MRISDWSSDVCSSDLHDVCADRSVQFGKRQARGRYRFAVTKIARQFRQQFGVDGAEQPLDLAAPLWTRDGRVDQADTQIGRSLFEMKAGEVRSVIDVQDVGNAAYRPGRIRSDEHTSELQSLMSISYAVFCLKKKIR